MGSDFRFSMAVLFSLLTAIFLSLVSGVTAMHCLSGFRKLSNDDMLCGVLFGGISGSIIWFILFLWNLDAGGKPKVRYFVTIPPVVAFATTFVLVGLLVFSGGR
jgi:hypothetical protein